LKSKTKANKTTYSISGKKKIQINIGPKIGGHPKQEQIWREPIRNILLECSRRWGKDWILARKGFKNILQDLHEGKGKEDHSWEDELPRLHYWCIGPKYRHTEIIRRELFRTMRKIGFKKNRDFDYNKSDKKLWLKPFDVLIEFRSADSPDDLVGEGIAGVIGTEVARWKQNVWFDNVLPALADVDGWALLCTTPKGRNWTDQVYAECINYNTRKPHRDILNIKDIRWVYYHGTYTDQTKIKGFIERVERLKLTMPETDFSRNFLASREVFAGQVLTGNSAKNEVFDHPQRTYRWIFGGYDHGHTHRAGIVVVGITGDFQHVDVIEAIGETKLLFMSEDKNQRTITKIIKDFTTKHQVERWFCSHERPENIQSLRDMGIGAISWMKTEFKKDLGGNTEETKRTARYLFLNRLLHCGILTYKHLQTELKSDILNVHWEEKSDGSFSGEKIAAEVDDVTDALTMAIWSYAPMRRAINKSITGLGDIDEEIETEE